MRHRLCWKNGMSMGYDYLAAKNKLPNPKELGKTHILLGKIKEIDPEQIFYIMQGEIWSPNGEANELIHSKGLVHTSMSLGDVVVTNGKVMIVDLFGFKTL